MTLLNKLDNRQKILLGLLGIALVILIWQVSGFFTADNKRTTMSTTNVGLRTSAQPTANASVPTANVGLSTATQPAVQPMAPAQLPGAATTAAATSAGAASTVDPATNSQAEYLRLVNEYQMAQLQRMIAEDNEAIAVAKRNAAQAMTDTAKLAGGGAMVTTTEDTSDQDDNVYSLVYTGQQDDGQWTATLKKNKQSLDVVPGKQLPDGSQVVSIDENGVLLSQNNGANKLLVTFSGVTQIKNDSGTQLQDPNAKPLVENENNVVMPQQQKTVLNKPAVIVNKPVVPVPQVVAINKPAVIVNKPVVPQPVKTIVATKPAASSAIELATKNALEIKPAVAAPVIGQPAVAVGQALAQQVPDKTADNNQVIPSGTGYTIQLTSDRKLATAQEFIATHNLQGKANYFHTVTKHGSEWYVVVYGQYSTREDAQKALKTLPADVRGEGAYIVSSADIQAMTKRTA